MLNTSTAVVMGDGAGQECRVEVVSIWTMGCTKVEWMSVAPSRLAEVTGRVRIERVKVDRSRS